MKINRDLDIELSPREVANEIWDMSSNEQASLLCNLADIYQANFADFCMQLEYVCTDLKRDCNEAERKLIIDMIKKIHEYVAVSEPKTGEWVWSDEDASWKCSRCDCVFEEIDWKPEYNFCPNCGTKMTKGR